MFRLFQKKQLHIYEMLAGLFVMTLIVSNIASIKVVAIGPLVFDAGTILFPLSYIVGDIVTEVYGYRKMRSLLYVGVVSLILTMTTFWVVQILPASPDWPNQVAYESILGVVWRIVLASVTALFLGEIMNAYVMARMKVRSKGKNLWVRMISSSVVGSAIDTVVFSTVAFLGTMSFGALAQLMATVFLIKITTEVIVSPLTIKIINIVKRREKIDTYEQPATYLVN
ncbi:queuosine precursor transporter [Candidatus Saccharibacteria bacterium oral taxon 955]|nr:queuosine precursor transporter [Candidatus Saccharibacteria bacterium oral taxon 955]